jgi:hypothetical protein
MAKFYILLLANGTEEVVFCEPLGLDARMNELNGVMVGEGDTREGAIANATKRGSVVSGYDGFRTLPMPGPEK